MRSPSRPGASARLQGESSPTRTSSRRSTSRRSGCTTSASPPGRGSTTSMVSEEIRLNDALEAAGIRPVETDLGEYILQLAGEHPVHIIAPAIEKTKEDVAELFSRVEGKPVEAELEALTQAARRPLREVFLTADVGITGGNFAVAETGSVVLVTNEGNGRLTSSLPRVHIAITGMERLVPAPPP